MDKLCLKYDVARIVLYVNIYTTYISIYITCISYTYIYIFIYMYILHYLQFLHRTTSSPHQAYPDHVCWVSPTTRGSSTKAKAAKAQATLKSKPPERSTAGKKHAKGYPIGEYILFWDSSTTSCPGCFNMFSKKTRKYYWILWDSIEVTA